MGVHSEVPSSFQNLFHRSHASRVTESLPTILQEGRPYARRVALSIVSNLPHTRNIPDVTDHSRIIARRISKLNEGIGLPDISESAALSLLHNYFLRIDTELLEDAYAGHLERQAHNDEHQLDQTPLIPLASMREHGVQMGVVEEAPSLLRERIKVYPDIPLLWQTNTSRIYKAEMLPDSPYLRESKGYHILHDIFDHMYTFDLFEREGLFERYADLLDRLGNPHTTDMFGRESEYFSTIMGEWRVTHLPHKDKGGSITPTRMIRILQKSQDAHTFSSNQARVLDILQSLGPESPQALQIAQVYSGALVVLLDQFRKHGYSYDLQKDGEGYIYSPDCRFPLLDPEYLAFLVEGSLLLSSHEEEIAIQMRNASFMIEQKLQAYAQGQRALNESMHFTLDAIRAYDPARSTLPDGIQQNLNSNIWYMADWSKRENYLLMAMLNQNE